MNHTVARPYAFSCLLLVCALLSGTAGCGVDSSCLAEGTLVSTPDGDVPIEDLRIGDAVWSVDPVGGKRVAARVVAVRSAVRACLEITTASGRRVVATADHPFYAPALGRYLHLGTLSARKDRAVLAYTGALAPDPIVGVRSARGFRRVYDITLDGDLHNFLAGGVLVHNKSMAAPTLPDFLAVQNAATDEHATFQHEFLPGTGTGMPVMLTRDPSVDGVGIVHVMSTEAFDTLLISADLAGGRFQLTLPMIPMAVDLRVTLALNVSMLQLTVVPVRGGVAGMPAVITVSANG